MNHIKRAVLTTEQMGKADAFAIKDLLESGRPGFVLMEEAGLSVVREITKKCDGNHILILCGPGNNGGDGFVIARYLKEAGWNVDVGLLGDLNLLKGDAKIMADKWGGEIKEISPKLIQDHDVIVDALFGTGSSKDISGIIKDTIDEANKSDAFRVAVDIPSGIEGNSGKILGTAFKADLTVTFCRSKSGHHIYPGKQYVGELMVADIGISDRHVADVVPFIVSNDPSLWINILPQPAIDGHKYHKGHAVIISGGMINTGASRMAAMSALRIGAGLVSVSSPNDALAIHAAHLTAVMIKCREQLDNDLKNNKLTTWCIGPAAGINNDTKRDVLSILNAGKKTVLDADALTVFEDDPDELFSAIKQECVLTPHAGEFGRLFPDLKDQDKITATMKASKRAGVIIIYKGADTVIASPEGKVVIADHGPPTLATAGTGDVLAGIVTGLLSQNMDCFDAAAAAVWIHGECARLLGVGLIAEDLINQIPAVFSSLYEAEKP